MVLCIQIQVGPDRRNIHSELHGLLPGLTRHTTKICRTSYIRLEPHQHAEGTQAIPLIRGSPSFPTMHPTGVLASRTSPQMIPIQPHCWTHARMGNHACAARRQTRPPNPRPRAQRPRLTPVLPPEAHSPGGLSVTVIASATGLLSIPLNRHHRAYSAR